MVLFVLIVKIPNFERIIEGKIVVLNNDKAGACSPHVVSVPFEQFKSNHRW